MTKYQKQTRLLAALDCIIFGFDGHTLTPNVVALCAGLEASLKLDTFIKDNPQRFIQCDIAVANIIQLEKLLKMLL